MLSWEEYNGGESMEVVLSPWLKMTFYAENNGMASCQMECEVYIDCEPEDRTVWKTKCVSQLAAKQACILHLLEIRGCVSDWQLPTHSAGDWE